MLYVIPPYVCFGLTYVHTFKPFRQCKAGTSKASVAWAWELSRLQPTLPKKWDIVLGFFLSLPLKSTHWCWCFESCLYCKKKQAHGKPILESFRPRSLKTHKHSCGLALRSHESCVFTQTALFPKRSSGWNMLNVERRNRSLGLLLLLSHSGSKLAAPRQA